MAEHGLEPPVLGIICDGSGLGDDHTLWGGEFLLIHATGFQRYAHFRTFSLPGGAKAIQEPRRASLGLLHELFSDRALDRQNLPFSPQELALLKGALSKNINCPLTSSVGRLFDGVASLLGLCHINQFEGQAAMTLEMVAGSISSDAQYQFQLLDTKPVIIDWQMFLEQLLADIPKFSPALIAAKFHNTLAEIVRVIALQSNHKNIVLSGGCFQNALLVEKAVGALKTAGFNVYCHEKIPPNDGGLAVGQLYAAKYRG
jgi:hydrogenase maturation protein HypF